MARTDGRKVTGVIRIEGAKIIHKNFSGKKTDFNKDGNRNFSVLLDDDLAERLLEDGWKVKRLRPRPDDPDQHEPAFLSVRVRFDPYPPIIQLINHKGRKRLTEDTVDQLDWTLIKTCDLIINPYNYPEANGRPAGVSAYLKAMYVTIMEDEFEVKYSELPDLDAVRGDD